MLQSGCAVPSIKHAADAFCHPSIVGAATARGLGVVKFLRTIRIRYAYAVLCRFQTPPGVLGHARLIGGQFSGYQGFWGD